MINLDLTSKTIPMNRFSIQDQKPTLMPRMFIYIIATQSYLSLYRIGWKIILKLYLHILGNSKIDKQLHITGDIFTITSPLADQSRLLYIIWEKKLYETEGATCIPSMPHL